MNDSAVPDPLLLKRDKDFVQGEGYLVYFEGRWPGHGQLRGFTYRL